MTETLHCNTCGQDGHANHAYSVRYAWTDCGPLIIRTVLPISSAKGRRIVENTTLLLGGVEVKPKFIEWTNMTSTWGWQDVFIHDEAEGVPA